MRPNFSPNFQEEAAQAREALTRMGNEIRDHHPILWAKISDLTPMQALPLINQYAGTSVTGTMRAGEAADMITEALIKMRPNVH